MTPRATYRLQFHRDFTFADGEALGAVPGAELLATDGLGHRRVLRDPGVLAAVASFLLGGSVVRNGRAPSTPRAEAVGHESVPYGASLRSVVP